MSELTQRILAAQIQAGEMAVVQDLHDRGLCMAGCELCAADKQPPPMPPSLEAKLAAMVDYCERLRTGVASRDNVGFNSYLDDPEVAEWLTRMKNTGRIGTTRFINSG